jgi:hypothetical protein
MQVGQFCELVGLTKRLLGEQVIHTKCNGSNPCSSAKKNEFIIIVKTAKPEFSFQQNPSLEKQRLLLQTCSHCLLLLLLLSYAGWPVL